MKKPYLSLIHPIGNPFARQAAIALSELGALQEIITSIAYNPQGNFARLLQPLPKLRKELTRRTWIPPQGVKLTTYPSREIIRILGLRLKIYRLFQLTPQSLTDWVYVSLDRLCAQHHLDNIQAIYAYEDGAANTFLEAKKRGLICFYDLPIVHYRQNQEIQTQEAHLFPQLAPALQATKEPAWKLERKEQEIALADRIIVPSSIVQQSLFDRGTPASKITVIPFGSPQDYFHPQPKLDPLFRVLFVGRVGPRKGVHYLLQAWQKLHLPNSELLLVGLNEFPQGYLNLYQDNFRYLPSVPHPTLNTYYSSASVFVFPSLVEGLALVLLEAMACGIPIITTANAGGTDIITDGVEGFIIPIRDVESLQTKIEWCYHHPLELAQMGEAARKKAELLNWELYRQRLKAKITEVFYDKDIFTD